MRCGWSATQPRSDPIRTLRRAGLDFWRWHLVFFLIFNLRTSSFQKRPMIVIEKHKPVLDKLGLVTLAQVKNFKGELVKDHRGRRDILRIGTKNSSGENLVLFLKRNWKPYKKDGLASLARRGAVWSIARQEWENSKALQSAGLKTATLVAYGEECGPLWEKFSFLVTEAAPGDQTVEQFLREDRDQVQRRRVFDALAREIRRMHDAGLATPDLFTRHIFLEAAGVDPAFCFIDMARMDRGRKISDRMRARDLAALNVTGPQRFVSAKERVRFLRLYTGKTDRALAKRVAIRTGHLLKRRKFQDFLKKSEPNVK
jgi:tRNA A-37 threonylcarbamoyl transferase component Bud32